MNSIDVPPSRTRTAITLSIAAHVCALCLLAALLGDPPRTLSSALDDNPELVFTTIEHRRVPPAKHLAAPVPVRTEPRAVPVVRTPPPAAAAPRARLTVARVVAPPPAPASAAHGKRPQQSTLHAAPGLPRPTLALALPEPTSTPKPIPTAAPPTPAPTSTPVATPAPAATRTPEPPSASFGGLFSQNYPPALAAPSDLAAIHSKLGGPVRIRVEVDETGRATDVRFVGAISDPALEQDIRSRLLALRYVPADCNGLHCEGTLEITY